MAKRDSFDVIARVYAVLQRIIDDNPDTDWSLIKAEFWRTVENDRPDLLRAMFREMFEPVLADWHKDHFDEAERPAKNKPVNWVH
ncbi:hypothetical protein [Bradyrhizobium valentinum]|uniref:Uncharacterized protein n=1 Tax=Bradyrhizobium valentinum TaxID=1518501 RepID=A0A0R3MAV6_9BRAD|nr:hypothetical protein [Bradyrhizobium valentinum]KRR14544.1 hypothetical protein CP49_25875 [Bradyrhizobium valentinum]